MFYLNCNIWHQIQKTINFSLMSSLAAKPEGKKQHPWRCMTQQSGRQSCHYSWPFRKKASVLTIIYLEANHYSMFDELNTSNSLKQLWPPGLTSDPPEGSRKGMRVAYLPGVFLLWWPYPTVARGICISCRETVRRAEGDDGEIVNTVSGRYGSGIVQEIS